MPLHCQDSLNKIRAGRELALGLGIHHMRGPAVPMVAKAAGFDWLFIDAEHGFISTGEIAQICLSALPQGVVPIVRICAGALDEGTRALDNGALGLVIPHVDTPEQMRTIGTTPCGSAARQICAISGVEMNPCSASMNNQSNPAAFASSGAAAPRM